jgi:lactate permease
MDKWQQIYDPLCCSGTPEYLLSALAAGIPLYIVFYMLAVKRTAGHWAALAGTASAVVLSIIVWGMPVSAAVSSVLMGACFGIFPIAWIIIAVMWLYNMTVESGEFEIIKSSLANMTEDRRIQAVLIAFAFGSFIEGAAGFGAPVAITAAMLAGLGFNPLYAAGVCLLANTAPVAFGSVGIPIITANAATWNTPEDLFRISQIVGRQLPFLSFIVPLWLCITMCGLKRSVEVLPAVLTAGVCFAGTQFLTSNFLGPYLPDILSALATIAGLFILMRFWKPKNIWRFPDEKPNSDAAIKHYSTGVVLRAWTPYFIMAIFVGVWGMPNFKSIVSPLETFAVVHWAFLDNVVEKMPPIVNVVSSYAAVYKFNWLSSAGTAVFFTGILSAFVMPHYGSRKAVACFVRTIVQLRFPILSIASILGLAYIMNYSGMSSTLGLAFTKTGVMFPFFAPFLGWLGVFLTGSDTSSNAMFGNLQRTTAEQLGLDPHLMVAANSSGGVTGKMISPQSISVATSAAGMTGQEGNLFRFAVFHSLAMNLIVCIITLLQAYPLKWMLP